MCRDWETLKSGQRGWVVDRLRARKYHCVCLRTCVCVCMYPLVCVCACGEEWEGNDSNMVTSLDEMGDIGRWGYLAFPAPACLLVPNELSDSINERTESIIIIISKGGPGSKQLPTLAGLTLVAPFDQQRQQGS